MSFNLFSKPKIKKHRKKTEGEAEKAFDRKEKRWAREQLLKKAEGNPELENKYISKLMGIDVSETNPVEVKKKEIHAKLVDEAFKQITSNPELREQYARRVVEELVGEANQEGLEGTEYEGGPLGQALETIDGYEALKERLGSRPGGLSGLFTPEVLTALVAQAPALLSVLRGGQLPLVPTKYVVVENDEVREMDAEHYKLYLEEKQVKQLGTQGTEVAVTEKKPKEGVKEEEKPKPSLNITFWTEYLDGEPDDLVLELISMSDEGDEQAVYALKLMEEFSAEQIIEMLQAFKEKEEYKLNIEKLEEKKEWLQKAIDFYKYLKTGENDVNISAQE